MEEFEPVHEVDGWYDGVRSGIADFRGERVRFSNVGWDAPEPPGDDWDHKDDRFILTHDSGVTTLVRADFRVHQPVPDLPPGVMRPLEFRWSLVE